MNKLHINPGYCKGCLICVEICAPKAIKACGKINSRGYNLPIEDDMQRCSGCKLCEIVCPDFALAIETDETNTKKK
ncbi:MAG: 4Fe-4S binding protein [Desulfobacterales bacterium]|jgi:2-oxoglutarate ferredoxin oxidoreductase subunit delta|nr:MAG: 4Fe-4S binding protein [Desulfobacterales bacterium]